MTVVNGTTIPGLPLDRIRKKEEPLSIPSACPSQRGEDSFIADISKATLRSEGALKTVRTGSCSLGQLPSGFNSFMARIQTSLNFFHSTNGSQFVNPDVAEQAGNRVPENDVLPIDARTEKDPEWVTISENEVASSPPEEQRSLFKLFSCTIS